MVLPPGRLRLAGIGEMIPETHLVGLQVEIAPVAAYLIGLFLSEIVGRDLLEGADIAKHLGGVGQGIVDIVEILNERIGPEDKLVEIYTGGIAFAVVAAHHLAVDVVEHEHHLQAVGLSRPLCKHLGKLHDGYRVGMDEWTRLAVGPLAGRHSGEIMIEEGGRALVRENEYHFGERFGRLVGGVRLGDRLQERFHKANLRIRQKICKKKRGMVCTG